MEIESAKLVFFSPTGTTRAVVHGIASGIAAETTEAFDITRPAARRRPLRTTGEELLVIGVPVYMGRVPALLGEWLSALRADATPTVCVVVYGNRAYENALLELRDIVVSRGGVPVACAAYIGEHSFAGPEVPVALGRPDEDDLRHANALGREVRATLRDAATVAELSDVAVPGSYPYGGITELWDVDFIAVDEERCARCGACAATCPVGAIDPQNSAAIDHARCTTCCSCIKRCPRGARSVKPGPVEEARGRLLSRYSAPKKPESYLALVRRAAAQGSRR